MKLQVSYGHRQQTIMMNMQGCYSDINLIILKYISVDFR